MPASTVDTTGQLEQDQLEQHRRELTGHCYRMLGSLFEAEDAVQETMLRAWRAQDGFEGRSSVRTWLHRVATNVCLDMLRGRKRRALPMGLVPSSIVSEVTDIGPVLPEGAWVMPIPDDRVLGDHADPAQVAAQRESIRLAFIAALQYLPARQRAVLLLREVLGWSAAEVADLLGSSSASVNSALQRARATLAAKDTDADDGRDGAEGAGGSAVGAARSGLEDEAERGLLADFVSAFEAYDVQRLTTLLHDDAVQSMPPYPLWIRGAQEIGSWMLGPGIGCKGSRLVSIRANGSAAFGHYRSDGQGGHKPFALQMLTIRDGGVAQIHSFLYPELFPVFGLPEKL